MRTIEYDTIRLKHVSFMTWTGYKLITYLSNQKVLFFTWIIKPARAPQTTSSCGIGNKVVSYVPRGSRYDHHGHIILIQRLIPDSYWKGHLTFSM